LQAAGSIYGQTGKFSKHKWVKRFKGLSVQNGGLIIVSEAQYQIDLTPDIPSQNCNYDSFPVTSKKKQ
jgi:hypothetical protein